MARLGSQLLGGGLLQRALSASKESERGEHAASLNKHMHGSMHACMLPIAAVCMHAMSYGMI